MNLYELSESLLAIKNAIDAALEAEDADPEAVGMLERCLGETEAAFRDKVEAVCYVVDERLAMAAAQREKARQLSEAARANESKAERLKSYLLSAMEAAGRERLETETRRVSVRTANSAPVLWLTEDGSPPSDLPERYLRVKTEPDVLRIKEDLENGASLPFATLGPKKRYVVVK